VSEQASVLAKSSTSMYKVVQT